jgi:anti-sigma factor RsiW
MSCPEFDWKGYLLGELSEPERRLAGEHLPRCAECRRELARLEAARGALLSVRDEEAPRRIAFVSDKVFEPGRWRRFWQSGPRLGFASAAMVSAAILVHGFARPAAAPVPSGADTAVIEAAVSREVGRRLDAAVREAVARAERRSAEQAAEMLAAAEKRFERERRIDMLTVQENFEYLSKRLNVVQRAGVYGGGEQ